uniref:Uncharacterized protein OJ1540_H01.26 n=1 Tax=Oryza sativa TaxID=4530 RepID=Q8SB15_ORYSA|nr:hypothetical protein [Oryza sativa Japonica Group]
MGPTADQARAPQIDWRHSFSPSFGAALLVSSSCFPLLVRVSRRGGYKNTAMRSGAVCGGPSMPADGDGSLHLRIPHQHAALQDLVCCACAGHWRCEATATVMLPLSKYGC